MGVNLFGRKKENWGNRIIRKFKFMSINIIIYIQLIQNLFLKR